MRIGGCWELRIGWKGGSENVRLGELGQGNAILVGSGRDTAIGRAIWVPIRNGGCGEVSGHLRKTDTRGSAAESQGTEEHVRKRGW